MIAEDEWCFLDDPETKSQGMEWKTKDQKKSHLYQNHGYSFFQLQRPLFTFNLLTVNQHCYLIVLTRYAMLFVKNALNFARIIRFYTRSFLAKKNRKVRLFALFARFCTFWLLAFPIYEKFNKRFLRFLIFKGIYMIRILKIIPEDQFSKYFEQWRYSLTTVSQSNGSTLYGIIASNL